MIILILIKKNLIVLKFVNIVILNSIILITIDILFLYEICDKEKLKYVLENNGFNEEVNNLARNYYNSLDNDGCKRIVYKQTADKNRYYADSSCLTY